MVSNIKRFEAEMRREAARDAAEAILLASPPALREKVESIRAYFEGEWRRGIVGRYEVAVAVRDVYDDVSENNGGVYGAKAVEAIKQMFGWDDGTIYQALLVADTFTPEQIAAIAAMRSPLGKPLSFSHVVALARVEDDVHRERLLDQAVRQSWTCAKLANAANPQAEPSQEGQGRRGRPLGKPRDFDAVLDQQEGFAKDFLGRDREVWTHDRHSLSAKVQDLDVTDITPERADRLRRHAELMSLLARKAQERADEARGVRDEFLRILAGQAGQKRLGQSVEKAGA